MKKKAPNLKELVKQDPAPQQEVYILIGENVWEFYRSISADKNTNRMGEGWRLFVDIIKKDNPNRYNEEAIILDRHYYQTISNTEILPQRQKIASIVDTSGFFKIKNNEKGVIIRENQQILTDICVNLSKNTDVQTLTLRNNIGELQEDLSGYILRLREDSEMANISATPVQLDLDGETLKKLPPSEKAKLFYEWYNKPLAYHSQQQQIYIFSGKYWKVFDDNLLQREIKGFFDAYEASYYSADNLNKIRGCLNIDLLLFGETKNNLLAFNNGVLNKNTLEFLPHNRDYWLTGSNQCDYLTEDIPTPNFDKWLKFISNDSEEREKALLAGLYMILNNRNDWELTLELIGEPGGGKSVYLEIGKMLSGDGNHEAIDLEILQDDKARDIILNKTFLYSADQAKYIGDASILKKISSGENVTFNPKNKKSFSASVKSIIAICSNTLPIYKNDGGGMERRRVIFPFNKAIDENDRDVNLKTNLKAELGGIIRKLYRTFPEPNEAKKALFKQKNSQEALDLKRKNDHILEFIQEFELLPQVSTEGLIFGSSKNMPSTSTDLVFNRLYWIYLLFCEVQGRTDKQILKPSDLAEELKLAFKTAGFKHQFTTRILGKRANHTNVKLKNQQETKQKWQDS